MVGRCFNGPSTYPPECFTAGMCCKSVSLHMNVSWSIDLHSMYLGYLNNVADSQIFRPKWRVERLEPCLPVSTSNLSHVEDAYTNIQAHMFTTTKVVPVLHSRIVYIPMQLNESDHKHVTLSQSRNTQTRSSNLSAFPGGQIARPNWLPGRAWNQEHRGKYPEHWSRNRTRGRLDDRFSRTDFLYAVRALSVSYLMVIIDSRFT